MIPTTLIYSFSFFLCLKPLLDLGSKCFKYPRSITPLLYTMIFCVIILNTCTYVLTDIFSQLLKPGGLEATEVQEFMAKKSMVIYIAMGYFLADTIYNTRTPEFILHHIGSIIYLSLHHELYDLVFLIILILGEITNPVLLAWRFSKRYPKLHYDLTLFNLIGFLMIRVFVGLGITFHSTLKYHQQSRSNPDANSIWNILNWMIYVGFVAGNSYWAYKIMTKYHYLTKKINSEKFFKKSAKRETLV